MWFILKGFCVGAAAAGVVAWWFSSRRARRRSQREQKLLRRTRGAERMAEVGVLVGHLAHEIRNPLSIIKVNLQLLSEDIKNYLQQVREQEDKNGESLNSPTRRHQRQLRKLETIMQETDRLSETLNNFLRFAGRIEMHPARCEINELLDDLIDFYEPQALNHGVEIRRNLGRDKAYCRVDADLLKQAFLNLFINAAQAMDDSGELIVSSHKERDMLVIDIIDTGPGIEKEMQPRIFDAYFTTKSGGTGLGLPTCRRIIEEHDGHIELFSDSGKGSDFRVELPLLND